MDTDPSVYPATSTDGDVYTGSRKRTGRFRFKSSKSRHRSSKDEHDYRDHRRRHNHDRIHKHTHHRRKHHRTTYDHQPPAAEEEGTNDARLSPETAFRESLFDALGDDEGAEYWESVYGQPIHTYGIPKKDADADGARGELEQMDEEEYASYVRTKMWERTREGMIEEQERLRREREKKAGERKMEEAESERRRFERVVEESLRRGRERKLRRNRRDVWGMYLKAWGEVDRVVEGVRRGGDSQGDEDGKKPLRNLIFWPVESGKRKDVSHDAVEEFMRHAPVGGEGDVDLLAILKAERIRWHPDKIQHRYGVLGIDDVVLRSATEVFQIVDRMWNELREKTG